MYLRIEPSPTRHPMFDSKYRFEGEYIETETGEVITKTVAIDKRVCNNEGEAFMFASSELFRLSSEFEIMVSVSRIGS